MADVEPAILNAQAALRVQVRTAPVPPAPLPPAALAGVDVPLPTRMTEVTPEYPIKAYLDNVSGLVIVEALVGKDGTIRQARAVESVPGLDEAAVRAVKQWRFVPTNKNGQIVDVVTVLPAEIRPDARAVGQ